MITRIVFTNINNIVLTFQPNIAHELLTSMGYNCVDTYTITDNILHQLYRYPDYLETAVLSTPEISFVSALHQSLS